MDVTGSGGMRWITVGSEDRPGTLVTGLSVRPYAL
jgi:hypothetical protein